MKAKRKCPRCNGAGEVNIDGVYLETYKIARRLIKKNGDIVANRDKEHFEGASGSCLSNRLAYLERVELLVSQAHGRQKLYKLP